MKNKMFIWIPKTSGTSFYETYRKKDSSFVKELTLKKIKNGTHGHIKIDEIYSPNELKDFEIFCIVRNPFSRAVSLYEYLKKQNIYSKNSTFLSFLEEIDTNNLPPVGAYNRIGLSQCNPQVDWVRKIEGVKIFKMEEREILENYFGVKFSHHNRSVYTDYRKFYCEKAISIVKKLYYQDFETFNYKMEL